MTDYEDHEARQPTSAETDELIRWLRDTRNAGIEHAERWSRELKPRPPALCPAHGDECPKRGLDWDCDTSANALVWMEADPADTIDYARASMAARALVVREAIEYLQSTPAVLLAGKGGGYELLRGWAGISDG
jgi:hypothetical protein